MSKWPSVLGKRKKNDRVGPGYTFKEQPYVESNHMARSHSHALLDIAPQVAETFRIDPDVAELIEPAVFIGVAEDDCAAAVVERIQLSDVLSGVEALETIPTGDRSPESVPITILVMDATSATMYHVADPRTDPGLWPWKGMAGKPT
jgi:hypothetical protein